MDLRVPNSLIMSEKYQYIVITSGSHTANELNEFDNHAINWRNYARWNADHTKYILKCTINTPPCFGSHTRYTKSQLQDNVMNASEWTTPESLSP
jgi:hypothetical protein